MVVRNVLGVVQKSPLSRDYEMFVNTYVLFINTLSVSISGNWKKWLKKVSKNDKSNLEIFYMHIVSR